MNIPKLRKAWMLYVNDRPYDLYGGEPHSIALFDSKDEAMRKFGEGSDVRRVDVMLFEEEG